MNCQAVQNQILGLPDPRELPPPLRQHVLACAECRAWAARAARLEAVLAWLPVPAAPGDKKEALIGELMAAEPVIRPMVVPAARPGFGAVAVRLLRRNAASVGGLAAAVLVAVGLSWVWPGKPGGLPVAERTPKDPFLQKFVAGNTALARATTPARKLEELGKLTAAVSAETRGMARIATGAELKEMAGWYETYVRDAMVPRAKELRSQPQADGADAAQLLDSLAAKLGADAAETEKLAGEAPQDAKPALKRMADAARDGEKSLRATAGGK
jgi:hypothetical protein